MVKFSQDNKAPSDAEGKKKKKLRISFTQVAIGLVVFLVGLAVYIQATSTVETVTAYRTTNFIEKGQPAEASVKKVEVPKELFEGSCYAQIDEKSHAKVALNTGQLVLCGQIGDTKEKAEQKGTVINIDVKKIRTQVIEGKSIALILDGSQAFVTPGEAVKKGDVVEFNTLSTIPTFMHNDYSVWFYTPDSDLNQVKQEAAKLAPGNK